MIKAQIVADSRCPEGHRLTSFMVTFPRIILAELNTHRMLSKNSASSRAIPFKKMVEIVQNNPFIPIAWQKEHKGMQGTEYITEKDNIQQCIQVWLRARDYAINQATALGNAEGFTKVTKQLCNRLLEPFMWHTVLVTGEETGLENFFNLRCPQYQTPVSQTIEPQRSWKDLLANHSNPINEELIEDNKDNWLFKLQHNKGQAEIHMMALAEAMWDAYNESTPNKLEAGKWHIPFRDKINVGGYVNSNVHEKFNNGKGLLANIVDTEIKVSTAMAARTSYTTVGEEKEVSYEKLIDLHDRLITQDPLHASPMEHCARVMTEEEYYYFKKVFISYPTEGSNGEEIEQGWCRNFRGFRQYRDLLETAP